MMNDLRESAWQSFLLAARQSQGPGDYLFWILVEASLRMDLIVGVCRLSIGEGSVRKRLTYQASPTGNE